MPLKTKDVLMMKNEIIEKVLSNKASVSDVAKEYGVSRQFIYKWVNRFIEHGEDGLIEISRRPHTSPNRIDVKNTELILDIREERQGWGGRKLRQRLVNTGIENIPSESSFNRILKKHGKIDPIESDKRKKFIRFEKENPNELWQMDFKGHFKMGSVRCHPLTVLDDNSRYSIVLKASLGETYDVVYEGLDEAFKTYGLPDAMTMDNGSPWKGSPPWTLSRLTVWLMRLGIKVGHSSVRHPQTQGKLERFHRSLKEEVLKFHQFNALDRTQVLFDDWRHIYNYERPHEGINLLCPFQLYKPSLKIYTGELPKIEYSLEDQVRKVEASGIISYLGSEYYVGEHLKGEYVAIKPASEDGKFSIYFINTKVGLINLKTKKKNNTILLALAEQ